MRGVSVWVGRPAVSTSICASKLPTHTCSMHDKAVFEKGGLEQNTLGPISGIVEPAMMLADTAGLVHDVTLSCLSKRGHDKPQ